MSFKRDGNDHGMWRNLQNRRINDLFAEDIPENEVIIMNTGRLSCSVCYHRPVFDTVTMLVTHRQGKKHKQGVESKKAEDIELYHEVQKRRHDQFIKEGTDDINMAPEVKQKILQVATTLQKFQQPYDPRVKKHHKVKPYERRLKLSLSSSEDINSLPLASQHSLKDIKHALELQRKKKNGVEDVQLRPYVSKNQCIVRRNCSPTRVENSAASHFLNSSNDEKGCKEPQTDECKADRKHIPDKGGPGTSKTEEEKIKKAEHYLKLRQAGWIKDSNGQWVKDDGVEFDSDEEPPGTH